MLTSRLQKSVAVAIPLTLVMLLLSFNLGRDFEESLAHSVDASCVADMPVGQGWLKPGSALFCFMNYVPTLLGDVVRMPLIALYDRQLISENLFIGWPVFYYALIVPAFWMVFLTLVIHWLLRWRDGKEVPRMQGVVVLATIIGWAVLSVAQPDLGPMFREIRATYHELSGVWQGYSVGPESTERNDSPIVFSSVPTTLGDTGTVMVDGERFILETDPAGRGAWLTFNVTTDKPINFVTFDTEFFLQPGASSILSFSVEGELITGIEERYAIDGPEREIHFLPREFPPGSYTFGFVLDPVDTSTRVSSKAAISNFSTGFVGFSNN